MQGLKKLVEDRLSKRLEACLPEFKRRIYRDVPRVTSFVCKVADGLYFHIVPSIVAQYRNFSCQLCWMKNDRSPIYARIWLPHGKPNEDGLQFSISHLWERHDLPWWVTYEEDWKIEEAVKEQMAKEGHEYYYDPVGVKLRPEEIDRWIASHPELYPTTPSHDERLVWPLVDDMVEKIMEYGVPYFQEVAANHGYIWEPSSS